MISSEPDKESDEGAQVLEAVVRVVEQIKDDVFVGVELEKLQKETQEGGWDLVGIHAADVVEFHGVVD